MAGFAISTAKVDLPQLLPEHERTLTVGSGISPEIIAVRNYRSVTVRAELIRLGFSDRQAHVPALVIPIWGPQGERVLYQIKPDEPRIQDGKVIKYETPARAQMALDVHPSMRHLLGDPSVPLFITEGVKKGDALASRGCCAVALLGVWNWRGTNDLGGKTALADWENIALNERQAYIVFDSDVMLKPEVHAALARLKRFLEQRDARVALIYLPSAPGAAKEGVDDYLAAGHTIDELLSLASPLLREAPCSQPDHDAPYRATPSGLVWNKPTQNGSVDVPLTNFSAHIIADVVEDDGAEQHRLFEVQAALNGRSFGFNVPAAQFQNMNWATEHLGAGAIVYPGFGLRDHARTAIQLLSDDVAQRHVYAHLGWRKMEGGWAYLHAGGAIGADGPVAGAEVKLSGALAHFALADPPTGPDLLASLQASLGLLGLGSLGVTVPVMGAVYLAPLRELLGDEPPDLTIWLWGPSGAFKSEIAALAEAHFGSFNRLTLPAAFSDTANAIERLCFSAKDALLVVDDYHPAQDRREEQVMAQVASRLVRGAGNAAGRGRMRADTTLRPALPPRCVTLATGERLPAGHSTGARIFPVTVDKGAVMAERLTVAQEHRTLLPEAMAAYIQWVAQRFDDLRVLLPVRLRELRTQAQSGKGHAREPGQVAHLYLGLETWLAFAAEVSAIPANDVDDLLRDAWRTLLALSAEHREGLESETPASRFLAILADGFASKDAYLEALDGQAPPDAETWGWEARHWIDGDGHERRDHRHSGTAVLLGKIDDEWLLLNPETTYQFLATAARNAGQLFPVDLKTLLKRLDDDALIAVESMPRRRTVKVRFGSRTRRVIKLRRDAIDASPTAEEGEHREHGEHGSVSDTDAPQDRSPETAGVAGRGNRSVPLSDSQSAFVPHVPPVPSVSSTREADQVTGGDRAEWEKTI